jgi:hypothetical protein
VQFRWSLSTQSKKRQLARSNMFSQKQITKHMAYQIMISLALKTV